jgi:DHA2 family methylenomycin A resistance protein-like MFS transporter
MESFEDPPATKQTIPFGFVVGTTSVAFVASQLDVSIVNIALPQIARSFSSGISSTDPPK